jgi:hypothetical protein
LLLDAQVEAFPQRPLEGRYPYEELRQPVAGADPVEPSLLARPHQLPGRPQLPRGRPDRLDEPAGVERGQPARVAPVGLHSIARPRRHQPGATTSYAIPRSTKWP